MDEMEMVYIPEGSFLMGSDVEVTQKQPFNYFPAHEVKLSAYWIDSHEVTNWQYLQCVVKGNCIAPKSTSSLTHENYFDNQEYDDSPVVNVTWDMAKTYCEWAGRRLPTEAEWEKAAHGIEKWVYPWGNDPFTTDYGNFMSKINDTSRVGSYELGRSYYGLYDMAGNVWEWVQDYFIDDYYSKSPKSDPPGPAKENSFGQRIIRGGCFKDDQATVNTYVRMPVGIDWYEWSTGFRCATSNTQN
jgi:formylglycine-generating enzyme required for sulfatase activity